MKELVAYLTQNIKLILLLTAGLVAVVVFASQGMQVFPPSGDPLERATEDINLGVGELMEANISGNLRLPPLTLANVLVEWEPREECEKFPNLHIRFDLENTTSEPLTLPPGFGLLLFMLLSEVPDSANAPIAGVNEILVALSQVDFSTTNNTEPDHVISPGGQIHYEEVINHPDLAWLPTRAKNAVGGGLILDGFILTGLPLEGYPEIAGNFADTADGEKGPPLVGGLDVLNFYVIDAGGVYLNDEGQAPSIVGDSLTAGFLNLSFFSHSGQQALMVLPAGVGPESSEWPNLVLYIPDAIEDVPPSNASYGFFVFPGGAPPAWDGVTQFAASDFDFITPLTAAHEELGMFWFFDSENADHLLEAPQSCTPTTTPSELATQGSSTATTSASPQATAIPTRTATPTERSTATPRPTQTPK